MSKLVSVLSFHLRDFRILCVAELDVNSIAEVVCKLWLQITDVNRRPFFDTSLRHVKRLFVESRRLSQCSKPKVVQS